MADSQFTGFIVDVVAKDIFPGKVTVRGSKIAQIEKLISVPADSPYIMPGFIDSHIHIESSLLVPSEFARLAVIHGTVATVSDPHEIANVLGIDGVRYMIKNAKQVPFKIYFGVPSCVPATSFETAGAVLTAEDIRTLFIEENLRYLSEMMNYPGVIQGDKGVLEKIEVAKSLHRVIDGHAPGVRGEDAKKYAACGISTDHECFQLDEALEKISYGMKIIIREGTAAKNYNALHTLIDQFPEKVMFCSDDKHCHELVKGHINEIVRRSVVDENHELMNVLRAATYNPVKHWGLDVGLVQTGDPADFIVVKDLTTFEVLKTYINGICVAENKKTTIPRSPIEQANRFQVSPKKTEDFVIKAMGNTLNVIVAHNGQLITSSEQVPCTIGAQGEIVCDIAHDILKLVVVNRYRDAKPSIAFVKNFGIKEGAFASSVAHDSHNIIACGTSDEEIAQVVNAVIESKGGLALLHKGSIKHLQLPIAGLMSDGDGFEIARQYEDLERISRTMHPTLTSPFMMLSFLALLVIPELKLSDLGLFNGKKFQFAKLSF